MGTCWRSLVFCAADDVLMCLVFWSLALLLAVCRWALMSNMAGHYNKLHKYYTSLHLNFGVAMFTSKEWGFFLVYSFVWPSKVRKRARRVIDVWVWNVCNPIGIHRETDTATRRKLSRQLVGCGAEIYRFPRTKREIGLIHLFSHRTLLTESELYWFNTSARSHDIIIS